MCPKPVLNFSNPYPEVLLNKTALGGSLGSTADTWVNGAQAIYRA